MDYDSSISLQGILSSAGHRAIPSATWLLTRKETTLVGGKYNRTTQHSHKMPRTICFCFKSVPKAHSTLGAPVFIYLHFFPDLNYLCKQTKKSWGIMRRHSASEYFKETEFFSGQLLQATLLKIWLEMYIEQKKLHRSHHVVDFELPKNPPKLRCLWSTPKGE